MWQPPEIHETGECCWQIRSLADKSFDYVCTNFVTVLTNKHIVIFHGNKRSGLIPLSVLWTRLQGLLWDHEGSNWTLINVSVFHFKYLAIYIVELNALLWLVSLVPIGKTLF